MAAIRAAVPRLAIGVSTSAAINPDPFARAAAVATWRQPPDFVAVNLSEPGWMGIARAAVHAGIALEAGLATAADAEELRRSPFAHQILRAQVEVDGGADDARAVAELIPAGWRNSGTVSERGRGRSSRRPGRPGSTSASDWKTCWCCPTAAPRRTTPQLVGAAVALIAGPD